MSNTHEGVFLCPEGVIFLEEVGHLEEGILKLAMTQGIWAVLFVALLFYVLKANEKREERLLTCLEQMGKQYEALADDVKETKEDIKEIREDVRDLKRSVVK